MNKMPRHKRDFSKIKLEFFESEIEDVRNFMLSKYNQDTAINKTISKNVKGRTKEKEEYKRKIVEKAIERNAEAQAKQLEIPIDILLKAKKMAIGKIITLISSDTLSMGDIAKGLEKIKTELGEPSTISNNLNTNIDRIEPQLSDEDKEFLSGLVKSRYGK